MGIGALALAVAVGLAEQAGGSPEVVELIAALPFGRLLAAALAVGLLGYATLSLVAAVLDPERHGHDLGGLAVRAADGVIGVLYLALAATAARLAAVPAARGDRWGAGWTAWLLDTPYAPFMIGATGAVLLASGALFLYRALRHDFATRLDRRRLDPELRRWLARLHRAGTAARGVAFGFCGLLLARAAGRADAGDVHGLGGALEQLGRARTGPPLLALVALGLMAYGAYQISKAWFRRIELP